MPFGKEESPNWNSLWISTACQVVKVPGWVLPSGANSLCILSTAAILCFCLATARSISFWQVGEMDISPGTAPPGELSIPIAHAPLDETCVTTFPSINLSTGGWSWSIFRGDYITTGSAVWRIYWLSIIWSDIFPPLRSKADLSLVDLGLTLLSDCHLFLVLFVFPEIPASLKLSSLLPGLLPLLPTLHHWLDDCILCTGDIIPVYCLQRTIWRFWSKRSYFPPPSELLGTVYPSLLISVSWQLWLWNAS